MNTNSILELLQAMKHQTVRNYVLPGLSSSLIGTGQHGKIRLFESERYTFEHITPHSHRFDFQCLVLRGTVLNLVFSEAEDGDLYACGHLKVTTGMGGYKFSRDIERKFYKIDGKSYVAGESYGMRYNEIHSIKFSKAAVLFFEGPELTDQTVVLEPVSDGLVIPTFKTEDWMFKKV